MKPERKNREFVCHFINIGRWHDNFCYVFYNVINYAFLTNQSARYI